MLGSKCVGKDEFFMEYVAHVADDAVVATFRRDADGHESVKTDDGLEFASFIEAGIWAAEKAPYTCPICGALLEDKSDF